MDNIESCIWLFCLDHPDTNITRVSNFIEWIFATGNYIFPKVFSGIRRSSNVVIYRERIADILPNFTYILTAIVLRCYARLGRRHCDATVHLACPQRPYGALAAMLGRPVSRRPHCACFEHVQNLAATSATLETLLRYAALPRRSMRSHNDPAAISGDLADFADRSEVAVLGDWGTPVWRGLKEICSLATCSDNIVHNSRVTCAHTISRYALVVFQTGMEK